MAEFHVNVADVNKSAHQIIDLKSPINSVGSNIANVRSTPIFTGAGYAEIMANLDALINAVNTSGTKTEQMGEALQRILNRYLMAEGTISGNGAIAIGIGGSGDGASTAIDRLREIADNIRNHIHEGIEQLRDWVRNSDFGSALEREFYERLAQGQATYEDGQRTVNTIIDLFTGNISLQDLHYNRNNNMPMDCLPQSPEQAAEWGWDDGVAANCHQYTAPDGTVNTKWVSPDGHYEVIFDADGNIVTASEDYGTFNYCNPKSNPIGHLVFDIVPWLMWGNAPDDSTSHMDRLFLTFNWGTADEVRSNIQSAMDSGQAYVNSGIDDLQSSANSGIDNLQSYIGNSTINSYIDAAQDGVNDFVDGVQDWGNNLYDSAENFIDDKLDWLNRIWG